MKTIVLATATAVLTAAPTFPPWGVTLSHLDSTVRPGTDFFGYSNGGWLKTAVIPPDRQVAGVSLEVDRRNEDRLKRIMATLSKKTDNELSAEERQLRDLYNAFENTEQIEAAGLTPVKAGLERIGALRTLKDIAAFLGSPDTPIGGPYAIDIEIDEKNPDAYVVQLTQSGLGMPDRDYYLLKDNESAAIRTAYRKYIDNMLGFAGVHDATRAAAVYALEERIAQVHWPVAERREAEKVYNPMSLTALAQFAPRFPWEAYFSAAGLTKRSPKGERQVVVREKSAFPKLADVFATTSVGVWRDYLTVHYLHSRANYLPHTVDDTNFAFYGIVLGNQKAQLPRDLRGIGLLNRMIGEALGKLYAAQYFPPEAKTKIRQLVGNLLKTYEADIRTLTWMTPATRDKALEKIRHLTVKVGYPDSWRDYSALEVAPGELVRDVASAEVFEWNRKLRRIDSPVDRSEWGMTPQTNNAYYNPTLNEIVFPAGILQPPYFDPAADDAVNYGEIGATIGHEISHAFDDQGSKYDASGRLNNWWTPQDRAAFDARTAALAKQFDEYQPLPGLHINGKLTLGENIADLAGVVIAHKAYRLSLGTAAAPVLNGYSGDQRFYIAYGQSWREKWTEGLTRQITLSDEHSPSAFRVIGPLRNDDGWYEAFPQVKAGDTYYLAPEKRVRLW
jgi:putative endopeptidase